jgi:NAD(P)-dependent dehydrogenase (short-subunit alcohol dehydrogenase family)
MTDKTVLITGSSSGIGRATAAAFLDADWTVYATARDTDDIADLAEAGAKTQALDVTDQDDVAAAVERIIEEDGRIDCLVNNAGYAQFGPMEDVTSAELHAQYDVNVYGPHRLARAVLPHMREQEDGTIINMSSVSGRIATPGQGAYVGSKFALEGMSDAMRSELRSHGVDVVLVEPGPVATNFDERASEELAEEADDHRSGAYDDLYEFYEEQETFGGASALAIDPERVADVVIEAACSPDPDPRYPVGQFAKLALLSRFVPDRIRDSVFSLAQRVLA